MNIFIDLIIYDRGGIKIYSATWSNGFCLFGGAQGLKTNRRNFLSNTTKHKLFVIGKSSFKNMYKIIIKCRRDGLVTKKRIKSFKDQMKCNVKSAIKIQINFLLALHFSQVGSCFLPKKWIIVIKKESVVIKISDSNTVDPSTWKG